MSSTTPQQEAQTPHRGAPPAHFPRQSRGAAEDATLGGLVHQLSEQIPELIRSELKLAQAEVTEKGKKLGLGLGMFSAAGLAALFALGTAIAAAVLALDLVLPAWAAALVVAGVLLAVAGLLAVLGRSKVEEAQPLAPERALTGVQEDLETLKGARP